MRFFTATTILWVTDSVSFGFRALRKNLKSPQAYAAFRRTENAKAVTPVLVGITAKLNHVVEYLDDGYYAPQPP